MDAGRTVLQLKKIIRRRIGLKLRWQRVSFGSKPLLDHSTLRDFGIQNGARLWVVCRRPGCIGQCNTELHGAQNTIMPMTATTTTTNNNNSNPVEADHDDDSDGDTVLGADSDLDDENEDEDNDPTTS
ncbi:hypothetical protein BGX31_009583 [Mortierella sp. GBA43]|nr:hypothetical protein BGX31_009583 [Mortierella sp. GBA43]